VTAHRGLVAAFTSKSRSNKNHNKNLIEPSVVAPIKTAYQYAVVEHAEAYFDNMEGRHGKQLSLAYNCDDSKKKNRYLPDDLLDLFNEEEEEEDGNTLEKKTTNKRTTTQATDNNYESATDEEEEEDENDDEDEINTVKPKYSNDGSLIYEDPSELLAYKAGAPAGGIFAIIQLAGASQHKVTVDDVVIVNKLLPLSKWKVGETITLQAENEVLLIGSQERTIVGLSPGIPNAIVEVMVEEITHDATVIIFKKKRRKNYRRKKGFRREVTMLRVLNIQMPPEVLADKTATAGITAISSFATGGESEQKYAA
jgi:large subunit ribosomal protein L21